MAKLAPQEVAMKLAEVLNAAMKGKFGKVINWAVIIAGDYELYQLADYVVELMTGKSIEGWALQGALALEANLEAAMLDLAKPLNIWVLAKMQEHPPLAQKVNDYIAHQAKTTAPSQVDYDLVSADPIGYGESLEDWAKRVSSRTGIPLHKCIALKLA